MRSRCILVVLISTAAASLGFSETTPSSRPPVAAATPFLPDPVTVQRFGAGYRYPQEGWIVLHLEGGAYVRGLQHGRLLAPEIAAYLRCYANMQSPEGASDGWKLTRTIVNTSFLRGFDREYLEEMKGIADGASAAGARFDDRAIDLVDIAALNLWPELMTLDDANDATPTGLEGIVFPNASPTPVKAAPEGHCSAFAATGKATRDGHAVIGHITMFGLYPSRWFNVWLDIKPDHGHRVVMQSYPGGIYSGMDYYLNDAGIAMVETTIDQTRFDGTGKPLASRVRKAMQYAETLDAVVSILKEGNNGLYNNEWLLADMNTDEIAMFELGTHSSKLWRSGKKEWFGGTEGFYWGCNNTKDLAVRLETIPAANDRPANVVWHPADRDLKWIELYTSSAGAIDDAFAKRAFTTAPLCSSHALDAKFTNPGLARRLQSWAVFGPPREHTWLPAPGEALRFKEITPLVSNPWTILGAAAALEPPALAASDPPGAPVDLHDPSGEHQLSALFSPPKDQEDVPPPMKPAWHGTILPAADADLWLASAFAEFERIVSLEHGYADAETKKALSAADYEKLAPSLYAARSRYFAGVRRGGDVPLARIKWDPSNDAWYDVACGKGVLLLAELRRLMGDGPFTTMMDDFGRQHAGKRTGTAEFIAHASQRAGRNLDAFFDYWLKQPGLPKIELVSASASAGDVSGALRVHGGPPLSNIEITVEYADDELTQIVPLDSDGKFRVKTAKTATRLVIDKYSRVAHANGGQADLGSFTDAVDRSLIIYGTQDETAANREAAEIAQRAIRAGWHNIDLPIRADTEVSEEELKNHHLILIGRPGVNRTTERLAEALPIAFGPASFHIAGRAYANASTAVLAAGVNPLNPRFCVTVVAGNSAAATYAHAGDLGGRGSRPELEVYDPSGKRKALVAPAPELVKIFTPGKLASRGP